MRRNSIETLVRSFLVEEGGIHASLVVHWEVVGHRRDWVWVLQGAMVEVDPRETGSSAVVSVCWVQGGGLLGCLVWMRN